jgi:hypothetical protein
MVDENQGDVPKEVDNTRSENGQMLARTWTVAANFRTPSDYGIPAAPTFAMEYGADGSLTVFACPNTREPLLTIDCSMKVRR